MSKAIRHAMSSVRKFGGTIDHYLDIHNFFDSSKGAMPDNRHRALLHTAFAIQPGGIMERIFGSYFVVPKNDTDMEEWSTLERSIALAEQHIEELKERQAEIGRVVVTRDVFEQHLLEDYQFIPTAQDFLSLMKHEPWMDAAKGALPPSHPNFGKERKVRVLTSD